MTYPPDLLDAMRIERWDVMSREWAMPCRNTFDCRPIGDFVKNYLHGISVDPFARNNQWATYTNDLNPDTQAQSHLDAEIFLQECASKGIKADCILFDPPYSPRQISECYKSIGLHVGMQETQNSVLYARIRKALLPLCKVGTIVLSFGWNSAGMGKKGFRRRETLLVAHGGAHNDTICVADERIVQDMEAKI